MRYKADASELASNLELELEFSPVARLFALNCDNTSELHRQCSNQNACQSHKMHVLGTQL